MVQTDRRQFVMALVGGAAGLTLTWPAFGQGRGPAPLTATKLTDRFAVIGADDFASYDDGVFLQVGEARLEGKPRTARRNQRKNLCPAGRRSGVDALERRFQPEHQAVLGKRRGRGSIGFSADLRRRSETDQARTGQRCEQVSTIHVHPG